MLGKKNWGRWPIPVWLNLNCRGKPFFLARESWCLCNFHNPTRICFCILSLWWPFPSHQEIIQSPIFACTFCRIFCVPSSPAAFVSSALLYQIRMSCQHFISKWHFPLLPLTLKWPRGGGVPRDPKFIFRALYYFRFRFFHRYFF